MTDTQSHRRYIVAQVLLLLVCAQQLRPSLPSSPTFAPALQAVLLLLLCAHHTQSCTGLCEVSLTEVLLQPSTSSNASSSGSPTSKSHTHQSLDLIGLLAELPALEHFSLHQLHTPAPRLCGLSRLRRLCSLSLNLPKEDAVLAASELPLVSQHLTRLSLHGANIHASRGHEAEAAVAQPAQPAAAMGIPCWDLSWYLSLWPLPGGLPHLQVISLVG